MSLAAVFSGGPVQIPSQVPSGGGMHVSTAVATVILISIPSVIIAISSYVLSVRAKRETARAASAQVDAEAYTRARILYESAIGTLRQELTDCRAENGRLTGELADSRRRQRPRNPRA